MRRLLAIVVVVGLAPGATGGLLETALGAHCAHACCQGQDFCHRGSGHDHETEHASADHHGAHGATTPLTVVTAIEPPSQSCLETCGVLRDARPKTEGATRAEQTRAVQFIHSAPRPLVLVADFKILEDSTSPRGPPRNHPADLT